jgi:hypothetical protein
MGKVSKRIVAKKVHGLPWTGKENTFLKLNATKMTTKDIAYNLGRTHDSVLSRAHRVGINLVTKAKLRGKLITKHGS